ncbi:MAG: DUF4292 domain-containing protein [Desulfuromonadales bacterium]|nr:DUF4292 domain-containing protein [Desulfuromonadales bacterium]
MVHGSRMIRYWCGIFTLLVVFVGGLLGGCSSLFSTSGAPAFEQELLQEDFAKYFTTFTSVTGLADIRITMGDKSFSGNHALFAESPDKLRAELYSLFGRPVYILVNDGESLSYFLPAENRYFKSPASVESFYRLTHIPLAGSDFVALLLGRLPSIGRAAFHAEIDADGHHVVTLSADRLSQELRFNQQKMLTTGRLWRGDQILLTVEYSAFTAEGFASVIHLKFPAAQSSVLIEFDSPTVNGIIPAQRFELDVPDSAVKFELSDT